MLLLILLFSIVRNVISVSSVKFQVTRFHKISINLTHDDDDDIATKGFSLNLFLQVSTFKSFDSLSSKNLLCPHFKEEGNHGKLGKLSQF